MVFITNFTNSRDLEDIKYSFDHGKQTNIDDLLDSFKSGNTTWSVYKGAAIGDIVVFMCAKEARNNLGMATSHIPNDYGADFFAFVDEQKALYKKYSGCLLGYGVVASDPYKDDWWMADIVRMRQFPVPIHIDDFRSFIRISRAYSITKLQDDQWGRLKWVVNQKNPGFFPDAIPPDVKTLNDEFEQAVLKEGTKPIDRLKKEAEKEGSKPSVSTVHTQVYSRNPTIASYVKKRANGYCQLCGEKAPFIDVNNEPYLECHHIDWLSKGGMDSIDNCVALCPNCHRKMHIIGDPDDIALLKTRISKVQGIGG